jgi:hypothetical protein
MSTNECDFASPSPSNSHHFLLPNTPSRFDYLQNILNCPSEDLGSISIKDPGSLSLIEYRAGPTPKDLASSVGLDLVKVAEVLSQDRGIGHKAYTMTSLHECTHNDASFMRHILHTHFANSAMQAPGPDENHHVLKMANSSFLGRHMTMLHGKHGHTTEIKKKMERRLYAERIEMSTLDELAEQMIMRHINRSRSTELAIQSMYTRDCEDKQDQTDKCCHPQVTIDFSNRRVELMQFVPLLEGYHSTGIPTNFIYLSNEKESMHQHDAEEINPEVLNDQVEQMISKHVKRRRSMEIVTSSYADVNRKRPSASELQRHINSDFESGNNSLFLYLPSEQAVVRNLKQRKNASS